MTEDKYCDGLFMTGPGPICRKDNCGQETPYFGIYGPHRQTIEDGIPTIYETGETKCLHGQSHEEIRQQYSKLQGE